MSSFQTKTAEISHRRNYRLYGNTSRVTHVYMYYAGVDDLDPSEQLKQLTVTKEALVSEEDIADDIIGDEEWSVISPDGLVFVPQRFLSL